MKIIVAGATGLVGGLVLERLGNRPDVTSVTTITRRPIPVRNATHRSIVAAPDCWRAEMAAASCDVAICCLGTTIKVAGTREAFAAVDLDAVVGFARSAKEAGARQFLMVTSVGADAGSSNFYLSVKGRVEADIRALGFERLDIFRPGLLIGKRTGPLRFAERVAMVLSPLSDALTPAVLSRYRSSRAETVADAIVVQLGAEPRGIFIHHNDEMSTGPSKTD